MSKSITTTGMDGDELIPAKYIKNPYALFRSECCKADIQFESNNMRRSGRPRKYKTEAEKRAHDNERARERWAKQKAARETAISQAAL
ncbi:MAG TPA: hypothetical protein VHP31_00905 [Caproicibacter sp.]|nr:hypothetical protein [Caproicibacter sp.]